MRLCGRLHVRMLVLLCLARVCVCVVRMSEFEQRVLIFVQITSAVSDLLADMLHGNSTAMFLLRRLLDVEVLSQLHMLLDYDHITPLDLMETVDG